MNMNQKSGERIGVGTGLLLMVGMVSIMFIALWLVRHDAVVIALLRYAYSLAYVPAWVCVKLGFPDAAPVLLIKKIVAVAKVPSRVSFSEVVSLINSASYFLLPLLTIIAFLAWKVHTHVLRNLDVLHDYWSLMKIQSRTNPCIVPVVRFTEYWKEKGLERHSNLFRALTPDEFAIKHDLITKGEEWLINYEKCEKVFIAQLGDRLNPNKLSEHYRALAAIFMTRIVYRGEEGRRKAKKMLDEINLSCDPSKTGVRQDADCKPAFDFSGAASLFWDLYKHQDIARIKTFFVHEKTFLMRLLYEARRDGKLPPSEFIWLKLIDRPLWYALYGVSKNLIAKGYVEGAAAFGQYWAAITAMQHDQILYEPYMHEVIRAFEKRLFEANMVSRRLYMTDKEIEREKEFGRIPEI